MDNKVFEKQIGQNMKAYINDILLMSMTDEGHLTDLEETFETINTANMKMNLKKSFF
jgi:Neuraminidase (sialidase)